MSDPTGPVRRRRIAGESKPAVPTGKAAAKKSVVRKPVAKKKAPVARKRPASATPAVADSTADSSAPNSAPAPTASRRARWLAPAALIAVVALVAGILLIVRGIDHVRGGGEDALQESQEQASAAASAAAETIFSYRYDRLDDHLTASKAVMTASFAKDFDKIAPALTELAPQRKIVVKAVVREAGALPCGDECSTDKASILVFVDQARLVGDSKKPTVFANRISVSMVKRDSGWLVDDIRAL